MDRSIVVRQSFKIVLAILVGIGLLGVALFFLNKPYADQQKKFEQDAQAKGLAAGRAECEKQEKGAVCNTLTVSSSATECTGKSCVIVYVLSKDQKYSSSYTYGWAQNGNFPILDHTSE